MKLIVFDMGHVFIDFEWHEVCRAFWTHAGISKDEFRPIIKSLSNLGYEKGEISTSDFLLEVNKHLKTSLSLDEFTRMWNFTFRENKEMVALIERLGKLRPLYLLSNCNENHYSFLERNYKVGRHFQERILSFEVGMQKPDERIYHEVLRRSGLMAGDCLFIDDLEENVEAAQAIGMHTIQYKGSVSQLQNQIEATGLSVASTA